MPHSSGGGSHFGGSHGGSRGGSYGGSRGGFGQPCRISKSYFTGATRFRYYRYYYFGRAIRRERYVYADEDLRKQWQPTQLLSGILLLPFFALIVYVLWSPVRDLFRDLSPHVMLKDEAHLFREDAGLTEALEAFYEKSGIPAAVITVHNEDWQYPHEEYSNQLSKYAYQRYTQEFDDEMHWLIVYSEPQEPDPERVDWYWEGMQGNNTDSILNERLTNRFRYVMQEARLRQENNAEGAIVEAFRTVTEDVTKGGAAGILSGMVPALAGLALLCFVGYYMLGLNLLKYRHAEPAPEIREEEELSPLQFTQEQAKPDETGQIQCRYCGTMQDASLQSCAGCGALLRDAPEESSSAGNSES